MYLLSSKFLQCIRSTLGYVLFVCALVKYMKSSSSMGLLMVLMSIALVGVVFGTVFLFPKTAEQAFFIFQNRCFFLKQLFFFFSKQLFLQTAVFFFKTAVFSKQLFFSFPKTAVNSLEQLFWRSRAAF